ncbi:hypothetical protein [Flavobacterium silvaticum]|uniref:Coproporphyrinogen III oxidase n=1 Tax=Flavobacterium silvaticum TaxID=1852020 RepID=A0A972FM70_9FLAO|nr:hypothetical protein [Flavobacterium silvaticum]NMH28293.1 hypothetical protein [Flavobacterium silvaticum]
MKSITKSLTVLALALMLSGTVFSCKSKEGMEEPAATDTTTVDTTTAATPEPAAAPATTDTVAKDTTAAPAK